MKLPVVAICLALLSPLSALGFSAPSHEAIVLGAMRILEGTPTAAKVQQILAGESPGQAAVWLDQVRESTKFPTDAQNQDATAFRKACPRHGEWHFTNFPVGSAAYDPQSKYADPDDVVHAVELSINVLEGRSNQMTKRQALKALFHLIGDIHQPLHCVTGFYDISNPSKPVLLKEVADPKRAVQDRGANQLYYTSSQELHALWDRSLPAAVGKTPEAIAAATASRARQVPVTSGDYHLWARAWASESMRAASSAYDGLRFTSAAYVQHPRYPQKQMLKITVELPGGGKGYIQKHVPMIAEQLAKGSARLARLLSVIAVSRI